MKLSQNLKLAIDAAIQAGKKIIEIYNSDDFNLEYKLDDSPLTIADTASNKIIENILEASNIPILSEEGNILDFNNRKNLKQLWIVDPLDGTKEFIKKNDEFTVNIALIENSKPVIGVIYAPALNVLYFSERKLGSYKTLITALDEFDNSKAFRLPLVENSNEYKVLTSRSHLDDNTLDYIDNLKVNNLKAVSVPMGSSLKFCLLAEGLADCYPRFSPCMEWDTAAGQIICEEAGFKVVDLKTMKPIIYNRENLINNYFIAKK
jgi:3'(2'), 5'-bisphosphate nucleotidase